MTGQPVQVVGAAELRASLDRLARQLPDVAPEAAADLIGRRARSAAPKRSGRLASSWAPDAGQGVLALGFGTPYAGAVHWGTGPRAGLRGPHNIRANPFLWRAIDDTQPQWESRYDQEINRLLEQVKGA